MTTSTKLYYEKRSIGTHDGIPTHIIEFDQHEGTGVEYDLFELSVRGYQVGDIINGVYSITEEKYKRFKGLFDEKFTASIWDSYEDEDKVIFDEAAKLAEVFDTFKDDTDFWKAVGDLVEVDEEKVFTPKTEFSVMHADLQVGGYSERTTSELIQFLCDTKADNQHLLIYNSEGEISAMIDSKTLRESSFEFKAI
jgi:hypothetical protein